MNAQTLILTAIQCTATSEDRIQNAQNALAMLEDMKTKHNSAIVRRAIRRHKRFINSLVTS
jgi:hypothetical protein